MRATLNLIYLNDLVVCFCTSVYVFDGYYLAYKSCILKIMTTYPFCFVTVKIMVHLSIPTKF